jgi:hypothetical protein
MFGNLFDIDKLVKKYLVILLRNYAKKQGSKDGKVGLMLQLREEGDGILFSGWDIENTNEFTHKEWVEETEVISLLKK